MKTYKWTKGEYKIATNPNCHIENQTDTRKGYILNNIFGVDSQRRSVTHLPTGLKMPGYFNLVRDAKSYAESLLPLTDWKTLTQNNATERFTPIKSQILAIVDQHAI